MKKQISELIYLLNHKQLAGLGSLALLAIREETSLEHQWREWGFTDLSAELITGRDLSEFDLIEIATAVATQLLEDLTTNANS